MMPFFQGGDQDEFGGASGARGEVPGNPSEVVEGLVYSLVKVYPGFALG